MNVSALERNQLKMYRDVCLNALLAQDCQFSKSNKKSVGKNIKW